MAGTIKSYSPANGASVQITKDLTVTITADGALDYAVLYAENGENSNRVYLVANGSPEDDGVSLSGDGKTATYTFEAGTFSEGEIEFVLSFNTSATGANSSIKWTCNAIAYTACGAPTTCSLNKMLSSGDNVVLSWSGATAGTANAVTGYEIQRAESTNGNAWGAWAALTVTTATSLSVAPPSTYGNYYRYRVRTRGAAGSAYYSAWKVCANTLRRGHAPLEGFTDSPLVVGTTPVKALHMLELHDRVNTLRAFYGLSAYAFSPIDTHGIAGWTAHVKEIRAAIDEIGATHEAWIDIPINRPRADVIEQLRAVVLAT